MIMYILNTALQDFNISHDKFQRMSISELMTLPTSNNTLEMSKNILIYKKKSLRRVTFSEYKQVRIFK